MKLRIYLNMYIYIYVYNLPPKPVNSNQFINSKWFESFNIGLAGDDLQRKKISSALVVCKPRVICR